MAPGPADATDTDAKPASRSKQAQVDPKSAGAQQIAELGIEPQATSTATETTTSKAALAPTPATSAEFGIEGP